MFWSCCLMMMRVVPLDAIILFKLVRQPSVEFSCLQGTLCISSLQGWLIYGTKIDWRFNQIYVVSQNSWRLSIWLFENFNVKLYKEAMHLYLFEFSELFKVKKYSIILELLETMNSMRAVQFFRSLRKQTSDRNTILQT